MMSGKIRWLSIWKKLSQRSTSHLTQTSVSKWTSDLSITKPGREGKVICASWLQCPFSAFSVGNIPGNDAHQPGLPGKGQMEQDWRGLSTRGQYNTDPPQGGYVVGKSNVFQRSFFGSANTNGMITKRKLVFIVNLLCACNTFRH